MPEISLNGKDIALQGAAPVASTNSAPAAAVHAKKDTALYGKYLVPGEKMTPEALAGYYNRNVEEAKEAYDANDWESPEQMYSQFEFLVEHIDLTGKTLLDVGAGNGLFFEFLTQRGIEPEESTAIDIAEGQIEIVRQRFPDVTAIAADFFKYEFEESYDVVTMFGVAPCLKFIFPEKDRISALLRLLDRALKYSRVGVAVSFLNHNCYLSAEEEGYEYVYHYPEELCTLLSGARYDLSTVHNDLVTTCFIYTHDATGQPFRFDLNRIDSMLNLLK